MGIVEKCLEIEHTEFKCFLCLNYYVDYLGLLFVCNLLCDIVYESSKFRKLFTLVYLRSDSNISEKCPAAAAYEQKVLALKPLTL